MKIVVCGNTGSGKSTLAKGLAAKHDLAFLELDMIAWAGLYPPRRIPLQDSLSEIDAFIDQNPSWVMEGAYADMLDHIAPRCDKLFFLNPGIDACAANARSRPWEPHKFKSKEEQDSFLPTLIEWLGQYETRDDEYGLARHRRIFDNFTGQKTEHTDPVAYLEP